MAEYSMPRWVGQPADPAAHYAQGFQIGVHLGAQQAAQQFQAQQLAQQQQKMALAQQQQEFENQYQAQVLSLKAGEMARQHQAAQMYSQMVGSGMDPSRALMQLALELGESPAAIINAQRQRDEAANMMKYREGVQKRLAHQFELSEKLKQQQQDRLALPEPVREAQWMEKTRKQAEMESDPARKAELQRVISNVEARHGIEEVTEVQPGGVIKFTRTTGGKPAKTPQDLTSGEQTRLGEDLQATSNSLRSLGQLRDQLNRDVVGMLPTFKNVVFDKLLSQFVPGFESPARVKGRGMIDVSAQNLIGELNRGGRFSIKELERIDKMLPEKGMLSSASEGMDMVSQLTKVLAEKGARAAIQLKRNVPTEILQALSEMSNDDLLSDAENGWLDPGIAKQAIAWRSRNQTR